MLFIDLVSDSDSPEAAKPANIELLEEVRLFTTLAHFCIDAAA